MLLTILLCCAGCPLAPGQDFAAEGVKALEAEKYEEAAALLAKAVEADPKDFTSRFHLGLAYSFLGKDQDAISEYRKTLELSPNLYPAELNLGFALLRQKQYPEAIEHLRQAHEAKPAELRPNLYLADALLESGDAEQAERYYQAAIEIDGKYPDAYAGQARARMALGDSAGAIAALEKAIEIDPAYREQLLEMAGFLESRNELEQAAALYARFPGNPAATERLADVLFKQGKFAEAASQLEKVVASSPTSANRAALAVAYANSGQNEKSLQTLDQAVREDPKNVELRMMAGRVLRDGKKFGAAAMQFHTAAQLDPNLAEAWSELAAMLLQLENYPQAIGALDQLSKLGKVKPGHLFLRAISLDKMQQYREALASYEQFLAASNGVSPDQEFQARQRVRIIQKILEKR